MIPSKALGTVGALGGLTLVGAVGVAGALPLIMMFSFACRNCGARGRLNRSEYKGKCPKCGQGLMTRDVKKIKVRQPPTAGTTSTAGATTAEDPLAILKLRLAKGEIDLPTYNQLKEALTAG